MCFSLKMINRMSFRNLKSSFSKQTRKQQLHHCDFVRSNSSNANGVMENKDQRPDSDCLDPDQNHCSVVLKLRKHENKKNKEGLWKILRKKLSRNRRKCRDRNEPQSDDSDQGHNLTSGNRVGNDTSKAKSNSFSSEALTSPYRFQRLNSTSDQYDLDDSIETEDALINSEIPNENHEIISENGMDSRCKNLSVAGVQMNSKQLGVMHGNQFGDSLDFSVSSPMSNKFSDTSSAANYQHSLVPNQDTLSLLDQSVASTISGEFYLYETPKIRSLTKELFKLSKHGWYWGPITRTEAEEKLQDQPDGAFLVRDSSDDRHLLSLSFRSYGKTLHTRIEHCNGLFSFYAQPEPEGHTSIVDLIEHSMSYSQSGIFCYSRARSPGSPSFPVRLTKPVSRFTQVRSLQYLCRFIIRQYTRFDHIQKLPLPSRIKGYIEEGHY